MRPGVRRSAERGVRYLLMCGVDEERWNALPDAERARVMSEYAELMREVAGRGQLRGSLRLRPGATATTLRRAGDRVLVTDGPFAETREQLGGYHLVECRDLDEAMAIAARIPTLRVGGVVEVRPVAEILDG
jgi:hypothetical protein